MQVFKDYNPVKHDQYKAITVKQPFADRVIEGMEGVIVSNFINYRGTLIICSDQMPLLRYVHNYDRKRLSKVVCMVNAYDCIQIKKLSGQLWKKITGLSIHEKEFYRNSYILKIEFVKELFPMPVKTGKSIWNLNIQKRTLIAMNDVVIKKTKHGISLSMGQLIIALIAIMSLLYILIAT